MSVEVFELYIQHSLQKLENLWLRAKEIPVSGVKTPKTKDRLTEIAENSFNRFSSPDPRLLQARESLQNIIDRADRAYILEQYNDASKLNLSLIRPVAVFAMHLCSIG